MNNINKDNKIKKLKSFFGSYYDQINLIHT